MYIDTHAHLNFKDFQTDRPQVIARAKAANVKGIINVGSNFKTSKEAIEIAQKNDGIYAAVGLHPIHVKEEEFNEENFLKLAREKKVVAIGETGLDYYYDKSSAKKQEELFTKHLQIAIKLAKSVILHSRDAGQDILTILMTQSPLPRGVMHCFQENWDFAKVILDMGFYISFTGLITFAKNYSTFEVIKEMPMDRILIETDCPYLTPEPYRDRRNEPAYVVEVAKKIAEIKKIPLEKVAEETSKNATDLFNLDL